MISVISAESVCIVTWSETKNFLSHSWFCTAWDVLSVWIRWSESSLRTCKRIFSYLPQGYQNKAGDPSCPCHLCQVTEIMVGAVSLRSPWLCSQRGITRGCPFRSGVPGRTTTSLLLWPLGQWRVSTWHKIKALFHLARTNWGKT